MSKKYRTLGLTLAAAFALSALLAVTASAATFLLAEWLLNGVAVTVLTSTVTSGAILLEDTKVPITGPVAILCEALLDGSVGPNGEDEITEVLTLGGVLVSLAAPLKCVAETGCSESATEPNMAPEKLPWLTTLELEEPSGNFVDLFGGVTAFTFDVTCTILGVKQTDECGAAAGTKSTPLKNVGTSVMIEPGPASPNGSCTLGGPGSGVVEAEGTEGLIEDLETGTLTVSSV